MAKNWVRISKSYEAFMMSKEETVICSALVRIAN